MPSSPLAEQNGREFKQARGPMDTIDFSQLNLIDVVAGIYLLFGVFRGFKRGLSGELARLVSIAVILLAGWQCYEPLGQKIGEITRLTDHESRLAGFMLSLVAAALVMVLLRWILKNMMEFAFKGNIERIGGMIAGFLRSLAIVTAIVVAASLSSSAYLAQKFSEDSRIGSVITQYVLPAYQRITEEQPQFGLPQLPGAGSKREVPSAKTNNAQDATLE